MIYIIHCSFQNTLILFKVNLIYLQLLVQQLLHLVSRLDHGLKVLYSVHVDISFIKFDGSSQTI